MKYTITDDCVRCTNCVSECPSEAIIETEERCEIVSEKCQGCGSCVDICPVEAIVEA